MNLLVLGSSYYLDSIKGLTGGFCRRCAAQHSTQRRVRAVRWHSARFHAHPIERCEYEIGIWRLDKCIFRHMFAVPLKTARRLEFGELVYIHVQ